MTIANPKKILIAPLDWGLGHTTRCVPLIRHLQEAGHIVTVAGNDTQLMYMESTFPSINTIDLEGYNISYSRSGKGFFWSVLSQVPHILRAVRHEHNWLQRIQREYRFDGILSDNRYGLYHRKVPSVIMTHQLQVRTGIGKSSDRVFQALHYRMLERFRECWVVDVPGSPNLGGMLSHPRRQPANSSYIGLLSQLTPLSTDAQAVEPHLLILLSGPEPQRTILSEILWRQASDYKGKIVFVEGSDEAPHPDLIPSHISYYRRITRDALQPLMTNANMVVCRSGYSTLMDITLLGKKAILIPTPGQTEQEYLGSYLHRIGIQYSAKQEGFSLAHAIRDADAFPYNIISLAEGYGLYKDVLDNWVTQL